MLLHFPALKVMFFLPVFSIRFVFSLQHIHPSRASRDVCRSWDKGPCTPGAAGEQSRSELSPGEQKRYQGSSSQVSPSTFNPYMDILLTKRFPHALFRSPTGPHYTGKNSYNHTHTSYVQGSSQAPLQPQVLPFLSAFSKVTSLTHPHVPRTTKYVWHQVQHQRKAGASSKKLSV